MKRTNTTHLTTFVRPTAIMSFSSPPGSSPTTTITLPPRSSWTSGLHWHETHTEYLRVISGHAWVSVDGDSRIISAEGGHITVPRYARHEWRRTIKADGHGFQDSWDKEELVVEEWTDPFDGEKEVFFRNLNSVITDTTRSPTWWTEWWLTLQLFAVFAANDNYPVFVPQSVESRTVQHLVTHFVLFVVCVLGKLLGVRGVYEEYTPSELSKKRR